MTTEDFKEKFNTMLIDRLNVTEQELKPESTFTDLGADSLDMVELIFEFEKEFFIVIPEKDANNFVTVGDAEEYLLAKLNFK